MVLTFAEDFTSTVDLDSELVGTSDSGLYWNRGVHPILTINGLLAYLPLVEFTFSDWINTSNYDNFSLSRKKSDIVNYNGELYQSIQASNTGNTPDSATTYWLKTNIESIRIKSFIWTVEDNFISALMLDRKLIENQYIYNVGDTLQSLPNDYSGWVFEPKGSDYVKIRINQIGLQANTSTPQNLYVVNQGRLIDTLTLNPQDGVLVFEDAGYTISGKGKFIFAIDSQDVLSNNAYNDALRYNGFVCYPVSGIGASPETATYAEGNIGNGMNFNVSAYLDSSVYVNNNKVDFAKFLQSQMEMDFVKMILHNPNFRSNRDERILAGGQQNIQLLSLEALNTDLNTIAAKYIKEKQLASEAINKTFDNFLRSKNTFKVTRKVI